MGKRSKRPGRAARDIHATIRADALALKASSRNGARDAAQFPELDALLHAARDAVAAGVPSSFTFEGRLYWLRATLAVRLAIFAGPADGEPLVQGVSFCSDEHGHAPAH